MHSESDQGPGGPTRARESAPDPPAQVTPPAEATISPPEAAEPPPESPAAEAKVTEVTGRDAAPRPGPQGDLSPEEVREHLRRRAIFLRELAEARELRRRVTPHRSRRARIHAALRRRTFRIN
ncbi:hypothetical protein BZB76_0823 [Actinomadura pelletieri DSM 43383]|uniref:Uncharacterized protein n=1 Tax=Actinomadura pelletieri DSM 43383 TaxID=1120940 RepID=A0A495QYZ8_9ACTN|nr:hypothetical protein [Actinomadura pelletieri]RKS79360.1 hypothetical protein BZB76_0823 [Actinomadura pelletieri DSM 43383]